MSFSSPRWSRPRTRPLCAPRQKAALTGLIHELSFQPLVAISSQSFGCHLVKKTLRLIHSFNETVLFN